MSRYVVCSSAQEKDGDDLVSREQVETRRTDRKAAEEDVGIIQDIFHRKAWIQEEGT